MTWYAGVDLGGTSIKWTAVDGRGSIAMVHTTPTPSSAPAVRDAIAGCVHELTNTYNGPPAAVCVGTPGLVGDQGTFIGPVVNIGGWQATDPAKELEELLHVPVRVKNDTTLALLAEVAEGPAARGARNVVGLFLGTGIGGGLYLNGELYEGHRGIAAEVGHMIVEPAGRPCGCGSRGCLEQYASGSGMVASARDWAGRYDGELAEQAQRHPESVTAAHLLERFTDPLAAQVIATAGEMLARAVGAILMTVAPELVVLGGGVMSSGEPLVDEVRRRLPEYAMAEVVAQTRLTKASLGSRAGAIGAALYASGWESTTDGAQDM
jgi:glucokinase